MPLLLHLLAITVSWDPNIVKMGPFTLSWHGVFTAVGIAAGVYVAIWLGRKQGITEDDGYSVALIAVPAGIIGARAMFVLENRIRFEGQWLDVFKINEGGITVYGAIIAGTIAACAYGFIRRMPVMRGCDAAGFGALLGMAIGRIGDLINGEHIAKVSSLPWAVKYTDPQSPGFLFSATSSSAFTARHPATTYEMIGDLLIIGIMAFLFVKVWKQRPGVTFFSGVVLYSAMRFGVSYLRIDSGPFCPAPTGCPAYIVKSWMTFPQVVSFFTFFIGAAGLIWSILRAPQTEPTPAPPGPTPVAKVKETSGSSRYRA